MLRLIFILAYFPTGYSDNSHNTFEMMQINPKGLRFWNYPLITMLSNEINIKILIEEASEDIFKDFRLDGNKDVFKVYMEEDKDICMSDVEISYSEEFSKKYWKRKANSTCKKEFLQNETNEHLDDLKRLLKHYMQEYYIDIPFGGLKNFIMVGDNDKCIIIDNTTTEHTRLIFLKVNLLFFRIRLIGKIIKKTLVLLMPIMSILKL